MPERLRHPYRDAALALGFVSSLTTAAISIPLDQESDKFEGLYNSTVEAQDARKMLKGAYRVEAASIYLCPRIRKDKEHVYMDCSDFYAKEIFRDANIDPAPQADSEGLPNIEAAEKIIGGVIVDLNRDSIARVRLENSLKRLEDKGNAGETEYDAKRVISNEQRELGRISDRLYNEARNYPISPAGRELKGKAFESGFKFAGTLVLGIMVSGALIGAGLLGRRNRT